jgi:folylpolyglutamate synthase
VSFHAFIRAEVDVAIIETHHGGENDATNFVPEPRVTAITIIDYDHMEALGTDLGRIAWHKAGIFKSGVPALSVMQQPVAARMLQERANEKRVALNFVETLSRWPLNAVHPASEVQLQNLSLACAVCNVFLQQHSDKAELSECDVARALEGFSLPGRFQIISKDGITWYLDVAHNNLSLSKCASWFAKKSG